jgi:hypothetical protein
MPAIFTDAPALRLGFFTASLLLMLTYAAKMLIIWVYSANSTAG